MRFLSVFLGLLLLAPLAAQAPSPGTPSRQPAARPVVKPDGTLAQLMRGIMFPNANIIFDVQTNDPGVEKKLGEAGGGALATFANIYTGWDVVQSAAIVLEEAPDLILKSGRLCTNGKPVPLGQADFRKYAEGLREVARVVLKAAEEKNQEKVSDLTNQLVEACLNCHRVYRNSPPGGPFRCVPHVDPAGR
jgi:hypothetical protein